MKLTERQRFHLEILSDGSFHRPVRNYTNASVFMTLAQKGLAVSEQLQVLRWKITDIGRAALAQSVEKK